VSAKKIVLISIFGCAILIYLALHFEAALTSNQVVQPVGMAPAPISSNGLTLPPENKTSSTDSIPTSSPDSVASPPSASVLREEIKQNVHVTPPSLLRFGTDLGVRMKDAKRSEPAAISLLAELKTCARPAQIDESPVQTRALCLVSARELEQAWPNLHGPTSGSPGRQNPWFSLIPSHSKNLQGTTIAAIACK
jgi:hypothetical protein